MNHDARPPVPPQAPSPALYLEPTELRLSVLRSETGGGEDRVSATLALSAVGFPGGRGPDGGDGSVAQESRR
jgi:hypothetical protein